MKRIEEFSQTKHTQRNGIKLPFACIRYPMGLPQGSEENKLVQESRKTLSIKN